jgi:hypothetical protein
MNAMEQVRLDSSNSRLLGAAFLFQAVASVVSFVLLDSLVVSGDIVETMTNVSNNAFQMRASILFAMLTAIGVAVLGVLLFLNLRQQNEKIALVALGLYLIEAGLLAASRIDAFSLLHISEEAAAAGYSDYLQTLGNLTYEAAEFGDSVLHIMVFGLGATLFYYLLLKSGYIPRLLALFGIAAASIAFIGGVSLLLGSDIPMIVFLPNLPFELGVGVWLLASPRANGRHPPATGIGQPG